MEASWSVFFNLLEEFEKDWYKFFFVCLVEFTCETTWPWIFVCREFLKITIIESISLLVIGLFKLPISSWFSFGGLYISRKLSISSRLGCEICWHVIVHNLSLFFNFCSISCDFSSFISYIVYLGLFSFLIGEPGWRFVNFVYPFREQALGFTDFFSIVFDYYLFPL